MNMTGKLMDAAQIALAEGFCKAAHFGQKRKATDENYCVHPIRVANSLNRHGYKSAAVQCAALLHDVVEDTPITIEYIEQYFGAEVANIVSWLTKLDHAPGVKRAEKKLIEAERLKHAPVIVKTIKLADRLDNMTSLTEEPLSFAMIFAAETRHLLDHALFDGDKVLWSKVDAIVREFQANNA
jgi:(p)ppGpp synthase/HD superfamily hydrolase